MAQSKGMSTTKTNKYLIKFLLAFLKTNSVICGMQKRDRELRDSAIKDHAISLLNKGYSKTQAVEIIAKKNKLTSVTVYRILKPIQDETIK